MIAFLLRRVSLVLALASLCGEAIAQEVFVPCRPGAKVFYVNGMNKANEQEVRDSARLLGSTITHFGVSCVSDVGHLFNPSDGVITDLLREIALQKATEFGVTFGEALADVGLVIAGMTPKLFDARLQEEIRSRITTFIQDVSLSTYSFTDNGVTYTTASLIESFRDRVISELSAGTKTVLVGHSQGNFFANSTHAAVVAQAPQTVSQGLAVVNVANPTIRAPSGFWLTSAQDMFMSPLADAGLALPTNFIAGLSLTDLTGHGFDSIYMNRALPLFASEADSAAGKVMGLLQSALNSTPTPVGTIVGSTYSGLFEIRLATNSSADLGTFTFTNAFPEQIWDIAVNPHDGSAFAISPTSLYTLDRATRRLTRLPQSNIGGNALAFSPDGDLYGMGGSKIYRFDTATGAGTELPISFAPYVSSGDLTFDANGVLYGTAFGGSGIDSLLKFDLRSNTVSVVGSTGYRSLYGLYFSSGYLFGVSTDGTIVTIDASTGDGTFYRFLPFGGISGLQ